jgi:DMSO/TMAO reductase YedYZ heme-binding membrane subunit
MSNKTYFAFIASLQEVLLILGIGILLVLPVLLAYAPAYLPDWSYTVLYGVSLFVVFLVMMIRPLADLLPGVTWIRPLVILRKGFGVFSASIIVAIMFSKFMTDGVFYLADFFSPAHWSLLDGAVLAPLGDLSALILLITSNKFSKRTLGKNWKRIQKLAYVYFYAGALYEYLFLGQTLALVAMVLVTVLVLSAYIQNHSRAVRVQPV